MCVYIYVRLLVSICSSGVRPRDPASHADTKHAADKKQKEKENPSVSGDIIRVDIIVDPIFTLLLLVLYMIVNS